MRVPPIIPRFAGLWVKSVKKEMLGTIPVLKHSSNNYLIQNSTKTEKTGSTPVMFLLIEWKLFNVTCK
jgi:hypothetical protein